MEVVRSSKIKVISFANKQENASRKTKEGLEKIHKKMTDIDCWNRQ